MWPTVRRFAEELSASLGSLLPSADAEWSGASLVLGLVVLILLPLLLQLTAETVAAAGVVGTGDPTTCTEAALNTALSGGGTVTFNCGAAQKIITLTSMKTISVSTTVDGGDRVALSGGNATGLFLVNSGPTLTLQHLVLANGSANGEGGAISNAGSLVLDHATVQDSTATLDGGAISSSGPLTITDSVLSGNSAVNGGALALFNDEPVTITRTVLHDNQTTGASPNGMGGAIWLFGSSVMLVDSELYGNTALNGGALHNANANRTITLQGTSVHDNQAVSNGGAGNGGGIYSGGTLTLTNVTVSGNTSEAGGGIYQKNGTATLTNVTLSGNTAFAEGGGLYNDHGTAFWTNVTVSGNRVDFYGGGIFNNGGTATLTNVTLSSNAQGGIYHFSSTSNTITLKNTIIASSSGFPNCNVLQGSASNIASSGFNLSDDTSCDPYFTGTGEQKNKPAKLGPLSDNGGTTTPHLLTQLPQPDSLAVDHGTNSGCPATDERGFTRPVGFACDMGAVEAQPSELTSPTPTMTQTGTATLTVTASATATPTRTSTPTASPSATTTPAPTATSSATATGTFTTVPTSTPTNTASPPSTSTPTPTAVPTTTLTLSATLTPTAGPTGTATATLPASGTPTGTSVASSTPTRTATASLAPTGTPSPPAPPSLTRTAPSTRTITPTANGQSGSTLLGQVVYQGRGDAPPTSGVQEVQVTLYQAGTANVRVLATPTTTIGGSFPVAVPTPGTYDVRVKHSLALSVQANGINFPAGIPVGLDFGTLPTGDSNGDDQIDIVDFSLLRATFGTNQSCGQAVPNPLPCADFDGTGQVDIVDFSLLRSNFGRSGPVILS